MFRLGVFFLWLVVAPCCAFGKSLVEVGFIELKNWHGDIRLLEPDFRFAHVALRVNGKWVHAHPIRGVEWVSLAVLEELGKVTMKIELSHKQEVDMELLRNLLGRPYDTEFSWNDDKLYCSELVAKLLGIEPEPMHFDPKLWPEHYLKYEGLPGISPGGLFRALAAPHRSCVSTVAAAKKVNET